MEEASVKPKSRKTGKTRAFVLCDVNKGMFRGEKIVSFIVMGEEISAIVNESSVKNGNKLEVNVLESNKDKVLIGLPGESFSTSRRVWMNRQELSL
jgi:hypothetical protein